METINHPSLGIVNASITPVREDGDGQVADTISLMQRYVAEDKDSFWVDQAVQESLELSPDPVDGVFRWVKSRVSFIHDSDIAVGWNNPDIVEVLIRPVDMIALGRVAQGDCDDYSMLAAAMLSRLGIRSTFVTIAADPRDPSRYSHVYVAAYPGDRRVPLDASHGPYAGWEAPEERVSRKQEWPVESGLSQLLPLIILIGAVYYAIRSNS